MILRALSVGFAEAILRGTYAASTLLGPSRTGRLLRTVSLPRMREHRLRTTLTVLGIALGVAVVVAVTLVSRSIVAGVTQTVDDLAGKADLQISAGAGGLDEALLAKVRAVSGVYKSTPVMQQIVPVRTENGRRDRLLNGQVDDYFYCRTVPFYAFYFRRLGAPELATQLRSLPMQSDALSAALIAAGTTTSFVLAPHHTRIKDDALKRLKRAGFVVEDTAMFSTHLYKVRRRN